MGRLIKTKTVGKNLRVSLYYFQDGYRIFASRRKSLGSDRWVESQATSYPIQDKKEALANLNSYRSARMVLVLHPVLRDEGTSMSVGYDYKI